MDLLSYVDIVARRRAIVLTALAMAILAAFTAWRALPPSYTGAVLLHVPTSPVGSDWRQYDLDFADRLVNTYATLAESERVRAEVARRLGVAESPALEVEIVANTELFRALARAATPEAAAEAANTLAAVLIDLGAVLGEPMLAGGAPPVPQVVEPATPPTAPRGPSLPLALAIAAFAGLLAGLALAFVAENVDDRLHDARAVEQVAGLPVLASVPRFAGAFAQPASPAGRAYRRLRAHVAARLQGAPGGVILVVAPEAGVGASTTVANLASALGASGRRVVVVDCDRFAPVQGRALAALVNRGARGDDARASARRTPGLEHVELITPPPSEISAVVAEYAASHQGVLIDAPPLAQGDDALALAREADGVLVVVRGGRTRAGELAEVQSQLASVGAVVLGVVLTHARGGARGGARGAADTSPRAARSRLDEEATSHGIRTATREDRPADTVREVRAWDHTGNW